MTPLYLTVSEAAEYVGVSQKEVTRWLNSADPPPYLRIGNTRKIQTAKLADYVERKQEVKWQLETG